MGAGESAVHVHALVKTYARRNAVDGVSFEVAAGETFALLGPNGAGKTTTTEILEGHRSRDGGRVAVLGVDPQRADRAWRARIGIVPQSIGDFHDLTVLEVVRHFAGYFPDPRDPDEVIEVVGLTDRRKVRAAKLSGGQRRRLDVALGILGRPEVLFLDEPTTGFDPEARRRFWELIRALRTAGTTILLTTHYLDEAEQLADRVAVINHGRLLALDTPDRLGGRDRAPSLISWTDETGAERRLETTEPTKALRELLARQPEGEEIRGLSVHQPTLEEIYLAMVDDKAEDEAQDKARDEARDEAEETDPTGRETR
jgi:ABC-2 type transport system ATP-binding protein